MADILPPVVADERTVWRKRVLRGGKIIYGDDGEFSLDCLIHDVSESGARISLKRNEFVPTRFFLSDAQKGVVHEAEATWIRVIKSLPQFGLKFNRTHELHSLGRKLKFLQRHIPGATI